MNMPKKKFIIRTLCIILAVLIAVPLSYILYIVCSYYRVEDNLSLDISGDAEECVTVGEVLSLTTYNIGFGAYSPNYSFFMDGGKYSRAYSEDEVINNTRGALAEIQKENPDFALFQEVDVKGTRSYNVDQTSILSSGMKGYDTVFAQNYDSPYFFYPFNQPIGANKSGLMSFSKFNIISATRKSLPIEESLYKYLDLDRAYTVSVIEVSNGKSLILYNVHLSAYTSDGSIADEQMRLLASDMEYEYQKGNYVVAAGDFNKDMLGDSSLYFKRPEGEFTWAKPFDTSLLPDGFTAHSGKNAPTCRNADSAYQGDGSDFVISVDGIITSPNVEVISCQTLTTGFMYSDHDPVSLKFILK